MVRQRVRIRFRKGGDLRLIGHRDLLRTMERLFRRAELPLGMSEGFHPKPRMNFPSPLPLGVSGDDEVMEVELCKVLPAEQIQAALQSAAVPDLEIKSVELVPPGVKKAHLQRATFEIQLPAEMHDEVRARIAHVLAQDQVPFDRGDNRPPVELHEFLEQLELVEGALRIGLRVSQDRSLRPRDVLSVLGIAELESEGYHLTRTCSELA